jgi:hypothetical protein
MSLQAKQKAALAKRSSGEPISPGGTKQKLVPLEKLLVPPKVDEFAPDLGKEVIDLQPLAGKDWCFCRLITKKILT